MLLDLHHVLVEARAHPVKKVRVKPRTGGWWPRAKQQTARPRGAGSAGEEGALLPAVGREAGGRRGGGAKPSGAPDSLGAKGGSRRAAGPELRPGSGGCSRPRVLPVSPAPRALLPAGPAPSAPPGGPDPARSRWPPGPRALLPAPPAPAPRARSGGAGREERAPGPRAARAAGLLGVLGSVRILGAGDVRLAGSFEG